MKLFSVYLAFCSKGSQTVCNSVWLNVPEFCHLSALTNKNGGGFIVRIRFTSKPPSVKKASNFSNWGLILLTNRTVIHSYSVSEYRYLVKCLLECLMRQCAVYDFCKLWCRFRAPIDWWVFCFCKAIKLINAGVCPFFQGSSKIFFGRKKFWEKADFLYWISLCRLVSLKNWWIF